MNIQNTVNEEIGFSTKISAIDLALMAARKKAKLTIKMIDSPTINSPDSPDNVTITSTKLEKQKLREDKKRETRNAQLVRAIELKRVRADLKQMKDKTKAETSNKPVHMKKLATAAAKLPSLNTSMTHFFDEAKTKFNTVELSALILHLQHYNRVALTTQAINQKLIVGMHVVINSGDPRYIGMAGIVARVQRIRCYVDVHNVPKPVYFFTSDVAPTAIVTTEVLDIDSTGTNG